MEKINIAELRIIETISENSKSIIYRAEKPDGSGTVVIKTIKTVQQSANLASLLKHEFEVLSKLSLDGVVKIICLDKYQGYSALVLEDFHAVPISPEIILKDKPIITFLDIAIRISGILGEIHSRNIIHRDIKPSNILFNRETGEVKITDFGLVAFEVKEQDIFQTNAIYGTLLYLSPEQTGRMNRTLDYRTDLYSLGITFYQLLTGDVPFRGADPLEILHKHLAELPIPPHIRNNEIPEVISHIIMKLLEKNAEDRYQNAFGLKYDLEKCLAELKNGKGLSNFKLGEYDISPKLNVPKFIIGREKEIALLFETFENIKKGKKCVAMVSGSPGIGKTCLINEIQKPVVSSRGFFITGKYEKMKRNVPYNAIIQAMQKLVFQILVRGAGDIEIWRQKILDAVGSNGRVITSVLPLAEYIIGPQPDLEQLGPAESENRFMLTLKRFILTFAQKKHPLVLFLDDLQWADVASLRFLDELLADPRKSTLFIIGSFRDNELIENPNLDLFLKNLESSETAVSAIRLKELGLEQVRSYLSHFLNCSEEKIKGLDEIVLKKTYGNPFFINQFIKTMFEQKRIILNPNTGWQWNIDEILSSRVTDNVIETMAERITVLPQTIQDTLKVCACIGNKFDIAFVSATANISVEQAVKNLQYAAGEDFIYLDGDEYRFYHDRIQEAALTLLTEHEKNILHYKIGKIALSSAEKEETILNEEILYIVGQLNQAGDEFNNDDERYRLLELNLKAANKTANAAAYSAALQYLEKCLYLSDKVKKSVKREQFYQIYYLLSLCSFMNKAHHEAEKYFPFAIEYSADLIEKMKVYNLQIQLYIMTDCQKAIEIGLYALAMNGTGISKPLVKTKIVMEILWNKWIMRKKSIESLYDLSQVTEEKILLFFNIAMNTGTAAFFVYPDLTALITLIGCRLIAKYGLMAISTYTYTAMACITGTILGRFQDGVRYGQLALQLAEKNKNPYINGRTYCIYGILVGHWSRHSESDVHYFKTGLENSLEAGDRIYICYNVNNIFMQKLLYGAPLSEILDDIETYKYYVLETRYEEIIHLVTFYEQTINCFQGKTNHPGSLSNHDVNEEEIYHKICDIPTKVIKHYYYTMKLYCLYIHMEYDAAIKLSDICIKNIYVEALGHLKCANFSFLYILTVIAYYRKNGKKIPPKHSTAIKQCLKKLKTWQDNCPENFKHMYLLAKAEISSIAKNNFQEVLKIYLEGIESAKKNGYLHHEGIGYELLANYWHSWGFDQQMVQCVREAYNRFNKWGGLVKLRLMEKTYPGIFNNELLQNELNIDDAKDMTITNSFRASSSSSTITNLALDYSSLIKALQTISGEIEFNRLLEKMTEIVVENVGAQKGVCIIGDEKEQLFIGAIIPYNKEYIGNNHRKELDENVAPEGIVRYVYKTLRPVISGSANTDNAYLNELYIKNKNVKSLLCYPIKTRQDMVCILYLENNLAYDIFAGNRLNSLELLVKQIAISLDNAILYKKAILDGLTELYNHTFFENTLEKNLAQCIRYKKDMSLMMIDIDYFKKFNDTYGHQIGDLVLKKVAEAIKRSIRNADIGARYGGDEFVILLPETKAENAKQAACRILDFCADRNFFGKDIGRDDLSITLSIGITEYEDNDTKYTILEKADTALYRVKQRGRNGIEVYTKTD